MKSALLVATLLMTGPALFAAGDALAARAPVYDAAQLPVTKGVVAQYSLTPRGDVDGLILQDGTEVHFPPGASTQLVFAVKPGDAVTIHGMKARVLPMVMAMSITNDASGATVQGMGGPGMRRGAPIEASGAVKETLHGPRGEANGVLLADGTIVRLPPPEARRLAEQLAVGKTVFVRGNGYAGALGKVVAAREIGPDATHLTAIRAPHRGERGHHGMMWRHGPHGGPMPGGPMPGGPMPGGPDAPPPPK
jgi:hypothetical protein